MFYDLISRFRRTSRKPTEISPENTFVFYRIIGNDLVPRHKNGQSLENLEFILKNEPELQNCEKRWLVNRIVDPEVEREILALLQAHERPFLRIPFEPDEYRKIGMNFDLLPEPNYLDTQEFRAEGLYIRRVVETAFLRDKNAYVMNNNGARNAALEDGRNRARWTLPWDGNCFVNQQSWNEITAGIEANPTAKYFAVPMHRLWENQEILNSRFRPDPRDEPQLIFRDDTKLKFDMRFVYGSRPKVDLLWRLGVPGPWDNWPDTMWDIPRGKLEVKPDEVASVGWVARLFSGFRELEVEPVIRGKARNLGIIDTLHRVDRMHNENTARECRSAFYTDRFVSNARSTANPISIKAVTDLMESADKFLDTPFPSVIEKTTLPPSGNKHDYWHPAPYWWPDESRPDGKPYIWKDGLRVPSTVMAGEGCEKYDRSALQEMFDRATTTALAWQISGNYKYLEDCLNSINAWFLDDNTRMNPHLKYAQVRMGRNSDEGVGTGIIEFKDVYYFLDAIQPIANATPIAQATLSGLKTWLSEYDRWLDESPQGKNEENSDNNHATHYFLQRAAISSFLEDRQKLEQIFELAASRIPEQFLPDGTQPIEMKRTNTRSYFWFNLIGWLNLALIAKANDIPFGAWTNEPFVRIANGLRFFVGHDGNSWPYPQETDFNPLLIPAIREIGRALNIHGLETDNDQTSFDQAPAVFHPYSGIFPYWKLAVR